MGWLAGWPGQQQEEQRSPPGACALPAASRPRCCGSPLLAFSLRLPTCALPLAPSGTENAHATSERPLYTLEVCMTGLAPCRASQFFRSDDYVSAQHTTVASGIQGLVPGAGAGRLQAGKGRPQWRKAV